MADTASRADNIHRCQLKWKMMMLALYMHHIDSGTYARVVSKLMIYVFIITAIELINLDLMMLNNNNER